MSKKSEFEKLTTNIELALGSNSSKSISVFNTNEKDEELDIITNIASELENLGRKVLLINTIYKKNNFRRNTIFINNIEEVSQVLQEIKNNERSSRINTINLQISRESLRPVLSILLPTLKLIYDRVIIGVESPNKSADSRVICSLTDTSLMLLDQNITLRSEVRKIIELLKLANANLIGYVTCK